MLLLLSTIKITGSGAEFLIAFPIVHEGFTKEFGIITDFFKEVELGGRSFGSEPVLEKGSFDVEGISRRRLQRDIIRLQGRART